MPAEIQDRAADVWEPLIAVADLAGGDWPQLARQAAVHFVQSAKDVEISLGVRLLSDIKSVFDEVMQTVSLRSETLVEKLLAIDPRRPVSLPRVRPFLLRRRLGTLPPPARRQTRYTRYTRNSAEFTGCFCEEGGPVGQTRGDANRLQTSKINHTLRIWLTISYKLNSMRLLEAHKEKVRAAFFPNRKVGRERSYPMRCYRCALACRRRSSASSSSDEIRLGRCARPMPVGRRMFAAAAQHDSEEVCDRTLLPSEGRIGE
jgi:hypothetical protein